MKRYAVVWIGDDNCLHSSAPIMDFTILQVVGAHNSKQALLGHTVISHIYDNHSILRPEDMYKPGKLIDCVSDSLKVYHGPTEDLNDLLDHFDAGWRYEIEEIK